MWASEFFGSCLIQMGGKIRKKDVVAFVFLSPNILDINHVEKMNGFYHKWVVLLSIITVGYVFQLTRANVRRLSVEPEVLSCGEALSPTIHDSRKEAREDYDTALRRASYNLNGIRGRKGELPRFEVLKGKQIRYSIRRIAPGLPQASAWTEGKTVTGLMFVPPVFGEVPSIKVKGDFVSFINFGDTSYGHYNNHNLPTIAYLREQFPETTQFILHDHPLPQASIKFLDPDFYKRVVWLPRRSTIEIDGSLTVPILPSQTMQQGDMRPMTSLRNWIHDKKGTRPKKYIVFYSRKGAAHDRVLAEEEKILGIIRRAMVDYGINYEMKIFTGKNVNGSTVSMEDQYELFRSAHTIIGSHGAGMLGNLVWTDPFPKSCEERTKILEFINGVDSSQVQANMPYISAFLNFRKWPFEYHAIMYTAKSSAKLTYIDDWALKDALKGMWGNAVVSTKQA